MEGPAVTDLEGKDYNDGKGTLAKLMEDPAKATMFAHLKSADGKWSVREDVWVRYKRESGPLLAGPLTVGFSVFGDTHHFGPELEFGQVVGDHFENQVLLIKTAWGGKSLYKDFRPPSSGGEMGPCYTKMIVEIREALVNLKKDFPKYDGRGYELAGFVWYQGWNDGCDAKNAVPEYEQNLVNLIHDVRRELNVPTLPFVVGELTGPSVVAAPSFDGVRKAQAAAAARPEFAGNVCFVVTHDFVRKPQDSPNPGHGHHEFGNAETYFLVGDALGKGMISLLTHTPLEQSAPVPLPKGNAAEPPKTKPEKPRSASSASATFPNLKQGEMAGYLLVPHEQVPRTYNAGFSVYAAAWPLVETYPGHRFQTGLFGTWMSAQYDDQAPKVYSDIEGGLGWWRDTRFPTETPKFIMGGVAPNFSEIANGPAHGAGSWDKPRGLYGVAQLSPWLLFPLDGLNIKQGTRGGLFGYGYLPLPLTRAKTATNGKNVPTGDNCWTLFLNTGNFKGPLAFFTPYFWSHASEDKPEWAGLLLDSRPSGPNKAIQMETQYIPSVQTELPNGETYARVARTTFPVGQDGSTVVLHRLTAYNRDALWTGVKAWFEGGAAVTGTINPEGASVQTFRGGGGATWKIYPPDVPKENRVPIAWNSFATPFSPDPTSYGFKWNDQRVKMNDAPAGSRVTLPEYFHLAKDGKNPKWEMVPPEDVPPEAGLVQVSFKRPSEPHPQPYTTPEDPDSCWKKPGPVAGPYQAHLGDGSVVTYYWYRFADQPALLNADLTREEREEMQAKVEKLHRNWPKSRDYLAPPSIGKLADLDPAQVVTAPKGLEIGYVPIATRQELKGLAK